MEGTRHSHSRSDHQGHGHGEECGPAARHSHEGDGHRHGVGEQSYAARRHPEHVVLDIGGDMGALILHTDSDMLGAEVEISATGHDDQRTHRDVLEREINGRAAFTAVFDKVLEGTYTLWVDDLARARGVLVNGSEVAELDWTGEPAKRNVA